MQSIAEDGASWFRPTRGHVAYDLGGTPAHERIAAALGEPITKVQLLKALAQAGKEATPEDAPAKPKTLRIRNSKPKPAPAPEAPVTVEVDATDLPGVDI